MKTRDPKLKQLAAQINQEFPDLVAVAHPGRGYCNTDRNIPGTRLRRPGKGRRGTLLVVKRLAPLAMCPVAKTHVYSMGPHCRACGEHRDGIVFEHNAAETYRRNEDVVRWIVNERQRRAAER